MKIWQGCLIAFVGFAVLIGVIVAVVFYATSGITKTADDFFAAANNGEYEEAHSLTSISLQRQLSVADMEAFMVSNGLDSVTDTSWASRSIENSTGELSGTLTTAEGGSIPIRLQLVSENEEWKINFIDADTGGVETSGGGSESGLGPSSFAGPIPTREQQEDMLFSTTIGFYNALDDDDFSDWRDDFVKQITVAQLEEGFGSMRSLRGDIGPLAVLDPDFETVTSLNDAGQFEIAGTYKSGNEELQFRYIYVREEGGSSKLTFADLELF